MVEFPLMGLDMRAHLAANAVPRRAADKSADLCTYDLAALVVHHGSGLDARLYFCPVIRHYWLDLRYWEIEEQE